MNTLPLAALAAAIWYPAGGQPGDSSTTTARAAPRTGIVHVDGRVDEEAWAAAPPISRFVQGFPVEGAPPQARTEVRVLYDDAALYIGVVMEEPQPARIGAQLVRRDERGAYDYFEVSLDPNRDRRTAYQFRVSAAGVQRDVYLYDDVRDDETWNAVWESAVQRTPTGWSAEFRIPFSQLRYPASDSVQTWGVNFSRRRLATNETTYFALESRIRHGKVSVFGTLTGLALPRGARRLEARPYVLSSLRAASADPGDPFFDGSALGTSAGVDLRYGLGAQYTLDLTLNPDFGQVEVDPAVINLSAFETFFPEKRPFFVEDAQIFDYTLSGRTNRLFYSRRVGREPRGEEPEDADFIARPPQTTILGAAKLTGRTGGGLSVGALVALTAEERGRAYDATSGAISEFPVEPLSQYGVVRLRQDLRGGATQVGMIATGTHRSLPADGSFDFLPQNAFAAGLDFEHNWGGAAQRNWALWGYWAGSHVRGDSVALIHIQRASNHYFQRPDATRFALDSTRTALSGYDWRLQFERRSARHWTGAVWLGEVTSGFEVNDLGFGTTTERLDAGARLGYQNIQPGGVFQSYRVTASVFQNWRHEALDDAFSPASWGRAHKRGSWNLRLNGEFRNFWELSLSGRYNPETTSDILTRGGPLMVDPASQSVELELQTDPRKPVAVGLQGEYQWARGADGHEWRLGGELTLRPTAAVELELGPQLSRERNPAQYVTTTDDLGFAPTFGRRYVFADLARQTVQLEVRLNVAMSPTLTLQLFAQPLLSAGDYLAYKTLAAAESFTFDRYAPGTAATGAGGTVSCTGGTICQLDDEQYVDADGDGTVDFSFSDRDFNVRSLRVNAVLRWEYRPGSTIFLVWQQSRRDRVDAGDFAFGRDLDALFAAPAENMFMVKLSYWLGL